jgi:hypothetical protein
MAHFFPTWGVDELWTNPLRWFATRIAFHIAVAVAVGGTVLLAAAIYAVVVPG